MVGSVHEDGENSRNDSSNSNQQILDAFKSIIEESLGIKFYTRCLVQGKVCSLMIDKRSYNNVASEYMVQKLGLKVKQHPWFDERYKLRVSRQVMIPITIGKYEEEVPCEVLPMDSCHLLLGKPWQNRHQAIQDVLKNRYSFEYKGRKIHLISLTANEIQQDQVILKQRVKQAVSESLNPPHKEKVILTDSQETPLGLINIAPELPSPSESSSLLQVSKDIEENPPRQTNLKREPWRDKPRQQTEEAKPKDHFTTKAAKQKPKQEVNQKLNDLVQSSAEKFTSYITHLSLPKEIDAGSKEKSEVLLADIDLNKVEEHKQKGEESNEIPCGNKLVSSSNSFEGTGKDKRTFNFKPRKCKSIYKETLMSFANLAPVLPSEIPCHFQDFRSVVQRDKSSDLLHPICHLERHVVFDPETTIETIACDVQGKEIVVPNATIQRYELLFVPKHKLLEPTFIKTLHDSDYNFGNMFMSCGELERKRFFRHGGFLFDKTHEQLEDVLMTLDKFSKNIKASQLAESFFREIVYYDNFLIFRKHLDDHAETLENIIDDLSKKSFVGHIFCTYNFSFRAFESAQDIQKDSKVIFKSGYRFWNRMREKHRPIQRNSKPMLKGVCQLRVKEQTNGYKNCLQGEPSSQNFNLSNLSCFRVGHLDLRTNPFQLGEDDVIMTGKTIRNTQEHQEQLEPDRKKAKKQLEAEDNPGEGPEAAYLPFGPFKPKDKEASKYTSFFKTKTRAILSLLIQPPWL